MSLNNLVHTYQHTSPCSCFHILLSKLTNNYFHNYSSKQSYIFLGILFCKCSHKYRCSFVRKLRRTKIGTFLCNSICNLSNNYYRMRQSNFLYIFQSKKQCITPYNYHCSIAENILLP